MLILFFLAACHEEDKPVHHHGPDPNSIEAIKQEIKQHPDSLMLKENLIEAYRNKGYYDSALSIADQEIGKDSGSAYLWNIKATLYFENNDTGNAINSLKHAIAIYPLPDYLVALATVYAETKNEKCLTIANELITSNKSKYGRDAYFIKGLYYNYKSQSQKAIALYQMAKYQDAITVLKRAVTIQNNFDEGYYWMGRCYEKLNKKDDAIESYQNALLYDKNYAEARDALQKLQKNEK